MKIEVQDEFNRIVIDGVIVSYAALNKLLLDPDPCALLQISREGNDVTVQTIAKIDPDLVKRCAMSNRLIEAFGYLA